MVGKTKSSSSSAATSFVELEPYCEWQKEEGFETLIIHLPDFKKEQLRVQVTNRGVLRISGERPIDKAQRKRFLKETQIPAGCNINDIKAKFIKGRLHVIMPNTSQIFPEEMHNAGAISEDTQKQPPLIPDDQGPKAPSSTDNQERKMGRMVGDAQPKNGHIFGLSWSMARMQERKMLAVCFGIAVTVMVAVGAFVAYKCGAEPSCYHAVELELN